MAREIIKPVFSRLREIRVLSQEDWLAHNWLVLGLLLEKCETKALCLCVASATIQAQVVRGRPVQNGLIDFFPPAIVNSQIAQVDRPKILERMVFGSNPLLSGVFVTFFLFQIEDLEKFKVFQRWNNEENTYTIISEREALRANEGWGE